MPSHSKEIKLANPRGFCAGVDRAIDIVNKALEIYGSPVYVKHEVVHNKHVVEDLKNRGAIFVDEIDEIPDNSLVILKARTRLMPFYAPEWGCGRCCDWARLGMM